MIRLNDKAILRGLGSSLDMQECLSSDRVEFAVRVVRTRAKHLKLRGKQFSKKDLEAQEIGVYRSKDARRMLFLSNPEVSLARQSFALSPGGAQVAVLSDTALSLYPVENP